MEYSGLVLFSLSSYAAFKFTRCHQNFDQVIHHNSTPTITAGGDINNPRSLEDVICSLEKRVQKDEGNRGIAGITVEGELLLATSALYDSSTAKVVIITGFPCMMTYNPPTETDGPPGALAIARALLYLGKDVRILTDECNEECMLASAAASGLHQLYGHDRLQLESFPSQMAFEQQDVTRLKAVADWADALVAIERAGPNRFGDYLTMSGKSMTHLVAPLEDILGYRTGVQGNIIDSFDEIETEIEVINVTVENTGERDGDWLKKESMINGLPSFSPLRTSEAIKKSTPFLSVGIGDGGNEVGMGKMYNAILASTIPRASDIACIVPTTYTIMCSVSNWGGYALAASLAAYHCHVCGCSTRSTESALSSSTTNLRSTQATCAPLDNLWVKCIVDEAEETNVCAALVASGARDGVTGRMEMSVDGMPWKESMYVLQELRDIARSYKDIVDSTQLLNRIS